MKDEQDGLHFLAELIPFLTCFGRVESWGLERVMACVGNEANYSIWTYETEGGILQRGQKTVPAIRPKQPASLLY